MPLPKPLLAAPIRNNTLQRSVKQPKPAQITYTFIRLVRTRKVSSGFMNAKCCRNSASGSGEQLRKGSSISPGEVVMTKSLPHCTEGTAGFCNHDSVPDPVRQVRRESCLVSCCFCKNQ